MDTLGRHLIAEFYGCDHRVLDDEAAVLAALRSAVEAIGAALIALSSHHYAPQGVTATALIAESHVSIHTWPEHGYAAVDLFTCGGLDPRPGFERLRSALGAQQVRVQEILRGLDAHVEAGRDLAPDDVLVFSRLAPLEDGRG